MEKEIHFRCLHCDSRYTTLPQGYTCYHCESFGEDGTLEVLYDFKKIQQRITKHDLTYNTNFTMWRYLPFLPVGDIRAIQPLKVGGTPLYNAVRLADPLGVRNVYIKDEGRNPTGSFKDRMSAVGIAVALERKYKRVAVASTGNMASSVACFAASAGLPAAILLAASTPAPNISQSLIYGARVAVLDGAYSDVFTICQALCEAHGWFNLSSLNPFPLEGQKAIAYEIIEQLGFDAPEKVFIPVHDGQAIYGIYKGFHEFFQVGFIDRIPQLIGVQMEPWYPLVQLFEGQPVYRPEMAVHSEVPRHAERALKAVRNSQGAMMHVTTDEVYRAMKCMAANTGVFGEPAAAASLAGALKMASENQLDPHERIVIVSSGVGLKDNESALRACAPVHPLPLNSPDIRAMFE